MLGYYWLLCYIVIVYCVCVDLCCVMNGVFGDVVLLFVLCEYEIECVCVGVSETSDFVFGMLDEMIWVIVRCDCVVVW